MRTLYALALDLAREYRELYNRAWPNNPAGTVDAWVASRAREILELPAGAPLPGFVESLIDWLMVPTSGYRRWVAPQSFEELVLTFATGMYDFACRYVDEHILPNPEDYDADRVVLEQYGYPVEQDEDGEIFVPQY